MTSEGDTTTCPACHTDNTTRRVSKFTRIFSDEDKLDKIANVPIPGDDPQEMRQWVDSVSGTLGDDLGSDFREYIDAAEEDSSIDA